MEGAVVPGRRYDHCFVVPAYGRSPHLADCLASLNCQTARSRVIVVTSTPYDGLDALVAEHGASLVIHGPNKGIGDDWNRALEHADATWVTLAHQDDIYLPGFVEHTMQAVGAEPQALLAFTGYGELLGDARRFITPMLLIKHVLLELAFLGRSTLRSGSVKLRAVRFGSPIPCPAVTLNLPAAALRFRTDLRVNMDWDAWIRLARVEGPFVYVRSRQMLHRIHSSSETSSAIVDGVRAREDRMMFEALWPKPVARLLARLYRFSYQQGADS